MKLLSIREGFDCDHSSVSYEFISEERLPDEARKFARQSSHRFRVGTHKIEITVPGEGYLDNDIQDALLEEYNIPLLIYEDYDWWNFLLMFDYDKELIKNLRKYTSDENDHTIYITQKKGKIEVWITVHIDYGAFEQEAPFKKLSDLFLDIPTFDSKLLILLTVLFCRRFPFSIF